jgi:F-box and WD-40 domain protein 1/11
VVQTYTVLNGPNKNGTLQGDEIYHTPEDYHSASILCLQYDDELMITGSSDMSCIVWKIDGYEPIKRLKNHASGVLDVCLDAKYIVSCSKDSKIAVYDRQTLSFLRHLEGHGGPVNAVQLRGNLLASASGDGTAKLWDLDSFECVKTFQSQDRGLAAVEFSDDRKHILAGGNDMVVYKWETTTGQLVHTYRGHNALVRSLFLDAANNIVVSGSYDQSLRVYNYETGKVLGDYENWTTSWILSAKSDYRRIICTSQDGRSLMLDFGYGVNGINALHPGTRSLVLDDTS